MDDVKSAPNEATPVAIEPGAPAKIETSAAVPPESTTQAKPDQNALAIAHARAHKRLTIIETIGVALLVCAILIGLAAYAFYQQASDVTETQPYTSNDYQ